MTRSPSRRRPARLPDALELDAELTRITAMNIEELREMWREKRKHKPPAALTKDLMAARFHTGCKRSAWGCCLMAGEQ